MTESSMVHCRRVVKVFGEGETAVEALRGVDLDLQFGELLMLVGPSGSGKTTLLSVIAGVLNRSAGECQVLGHDFETMNENQRSAVRGHDIGFVFQSFNLVDTLSLVENVAIPLMILGKERPPALEEARQLLSEVGLAKRADARPSQCSGGERQRTAICRALIHRPKLVVCDEPTSALDHVTGGLIMKLLRDRAVNHERSLIVVTHDARIFEYADRIATMEDGRILNVHDAKNGDIPRVVQP